MAIYEPRLKAPSTSDKNYLHYTKGGYNYAIEIANGSCLPNCVGYAWGRWRELLGKKHKLSTRNAENWWDNTDDGYKRGQTPKLGSIMCWRKGSTSSGSDGYGHVAVVEQINDDGSLVCSNSAYNSTRFYLKTMKAPYNLGTGYAFQGFIHLPIEFKVESPKKETSTTTSNTPKVESAASLDKTLVGKYATTDKLNIRSGAGKTKPLLVTIPKGTQVSNYGYYTAVKGVKWLYVQFTYNGTTYTGFASSEYLTKVTASNTAISQKYFKQYTGKSGSIVDSLKAIGVNSSFDYRAKIAKANGITDYASTATQNIKLLNLLKQGKLIAP